MFFLKVFKRRYLNLTDNLAHQSESVKEKAKEEFHGKFFGFLTKLKITTDVKGYCCVVINFGIFLPENSNHHLD